MRNGNLREELHRRSHADRDDYSGQCASGVCCERPIAKKVGMYMQFTAKHAVSYIAYQGKGATRSADEHGPSKRSRKCNKVIELWNMN